MVGTIIGLDIGDVRIGVARANTIAKIPEALAIIANDELALQSISEVVTTHQADLLVVGLPLHASGEMTEQAHKIKAQADELAKNLGLAVVYVDESLSSLQADNYTATNEHNDSIAACVILSRYFEDGGIKHV